jgi:predicted LPLAT superfamily acyltransferase
MEFIHLPSYGEYQSQWLNWLVVGCWLLVGHSVRYARLLVVVTYYLLLTTHYLLPTTYYLLPTTYSLFHLTVNKICKTTLI